MSETETSGGDLAIEQVSKRYGHSAVVDRVSLTIRQGEFLTLLGPSGSGKTTLLMIIAGFVTPDEGQILLGHRPIGHLAPEQRNFGMVFQGYALFPHLSVFDNVAFPLKVRRRPAAEIERKVDEALDLVQLADKAKRLPRQLSGGQQQRVALARAMVFTPHLLLLDEPLSALDKKLRGELQDELKRLHRRVGITFIYVTHDQDEALSMSDRIAVMREGKVIQCGAPTDLYEQPKTRFIAEFLGRSNFIQGRVDGHSDRGVVVTSNGTTFVQSAGGEPVPPTGAKVVIALRPEKIALGAGADGGGNNINGVVTDVSYFGSEFNLHVSTRDFGPLLVTLPAWARGAPPAPGEPVMLRWQDHAGVMVQDA